MEGFKQKVGRPKKDKTFLKIQVNYKLPQWIVNWLRSQDSPAAQLIEKSLRKQYDIKPPKKDKSNDKIK